jgi:hypothetical protein
MTQATDAKSSMVFAEGREIKEDKSEKTATGK